MTKTDDLLMEISRKVDVLISCTLMRDAEPEKQARMLKTKGLTFKEISELLSVPEGTLKTWLITKRKKNG